MSDSMILRVRRKIVLASLLAVFVSLCVLVFAINYVHYLQVDASLRSAMDEIANSLEGKREGGHEGGLQPTRGAGVGEEVEQGEQGEGVAINSNWQGIHERKSAKTQYANRFFCVLVAPDGSMLIKAKGNSELGNDYVLDLAQRALAADSSEGMLDDYKYVVEQTGDQMRVLFLDCTTELESRNQLLVVSIAVGSCAFVIASLFVVYVSGLAVRPLEESASKQKRFVADAGHELKTPLSVIATNMDILEMDLEDQPEELEWIESTNRQVENMKRLVNDLIVLSKLEEQQADIVLAEVSLTDVAHECVLTFAPLARQQGREIVASIDEGVNVRADEPSIRQLIQILIDNAIKYATGDGTIHIEVSREGKRAIFVTRNQWDHCVDTQELASLFDRFVRAEKSRDRSNGSGGYGLGLSIARAIAQKNGAMLTVSEDADGRIVFRVIFP